MSGSRSSMSLFRAPPRQFRRVESVFATSKAGWSSSRQGDGDSHRSRRSRGWSPKLPPTGRPIGPRSSRSEPNRDVGREPGLEKMGSRVYSFAGAGGARDALCRISKRRRRSSSVVLGRSSNAPASRDREPTSFVGQLPSSARVRESSNHSPREPMAAPIPILAEKTCGGAERPHPSRSTVSSKGPGRRCPSRIQGKKKKNHSRSCSTTGPRTAYDLFGHSRCIGGPPEVVGPCPRLVEGRMDFPVDPAGPSPRSSQTFYGHSAT